MGNVRKYAIVNWFTLFRFVTSLCSTRCHARLVAVRHSNLEQVHTPRTNIVLADYLADAVSMACFPGAVYQQRKGGCVSEETWRGVKSLAHYDEDIGLPVVCR